MGQKEGMPNLQPKMRKENGGMAETSDAHETDPLPTFVETALASSLSGEEKSRALRFTDAEEHLAREQ